MEASFFDRIRFFSQDGFVLKREKSAARVDFTGGMGYTLFVYIKAAPHNPLFPS